MAEAHDARNPESNARRDREASDDERGRNVEQERELEKVERSRSEGRDHPPSDTGRPKDTPWLGGG